MLAGVNELLNPLGGKNLVAALQVILVWRTLFDAEVASFAAAKSRNACSAKKPQLSFQPILVNLAGRIVTLRNSGFLRVP